MNTKKLNPIYWLKKLNKKFVKFEQTGFQGVMELATDLDNNDNKIHCKYCESILPIFKMMVIAKSVKEGEIYRVKCRHCKKINKIKKGAF